MTIGVVACGYADGYPRHCSTGTPVLVQGIRTRMVGRVSMDMITVDLEPLILRVLKSALVARSRYGGEPAMAQFCRLTK